MSEPLISGSRILVTGASGLMGGALVRELARHNEVHAAARFSSEDARAQVADTGAQVVVFDLADPDLSALPTEADYVFHCGAGLPGTMSQAAMFEVNVQATGRLMSRFRSAKAFVHCSSAGVYASKDGAYAETDPVGVDRHPNPDYPLTKIAGEQLVQFLAGEFGLPSVILRIFALYGVRGGFPTLLIRKVVDGEPVPLPPTRPVTQSPIHERDFVAKAIRAAMIAAVPPPVINFGGTDHATVEEYTALAGELAGRPAVYADVAAGYAPSPGDMTTMKAALGATEVDIRAGVADVVAAICQENQRVLPDA